MSKIVDLQKASTQYKACRDSYHEKIKNIMKPGDEFILRRGQYVVDCEVIEVHRKDLKVKVKSKQTGSEYWLYMPGAAGVDK